MLEDNDFVAQPTPSSQASPVFRRLRKGPRPHVTLSSVPEGEERQSVSRQFFLEASPTANIPESEAKVAEDILAASADEQEESRVEEERVAVGDRSRILKFPTHHKDPSMEYTSNEGKGVHLHTLVDHERKRSNERG